MLLYMVADRYGRKISDYYKSVVEAGKLKEDATDFVVAIDDTGMRVLTVEEESLTLPGGQLEETNDSIH